MTSFERIDLFHFYTLIVIISVTCEVIEQFVLRSYSFHFRLLIVINISEKPSPPWDPS